VVEYAKSPRGLWVRARAEGDAVVVEAQERVAVRGGLAVGLGADGEVRWEAPAVGAPPAGAWYAVGGVEFNAAWAALRVPTLAWPDLARGVQRHLVGLIASGWGDTVAEVVGWFADPLASASCVVPACYRVVAGGGCLAGFEGLVLRPVRVDVDDAGEALFAERWADVVGVAMPRLEVQREDFVRDMLLGTAVVVGSSHARKAFSSASSNRRSGRKALSASGPSSSRKCLTVLQ
jgi:hypothetical protein